MNRFIPAFVIVTLIASGASALTIEDKAGRNADGSSRFDDPDNAIPFPHVADDGSMQPGNNFQMQPAGNSGASFGFTGKGNSDFDAFQRAQERMQQ